MLDQATTQDGGVSNFAVGSYTGDGTIATVTCGFLPRYLKLINLTDRIVHEVTLDMADLTALKTAADGTMTNEAAAGILLQGGQDGHRGFVVPAAINIAAKAFHYIAVG